MWYFLIIASSMMVIVTIQRRKEEAKLKSSRAVVVVSLGDRRWYIRQEWGNKTSYGCHCHCCAAHSPNSSRIGDQLVSHRSTTTPRRRCFRSSDCSWNEITQFERSKNDQYSTIDHIQIFNECVRAHTQNTAARLPTLFFLGGDSTFTLNLFFYSSFCCLSQNSLLNNYIFNIDSLLNDIFAVFVEIVLIYSVDVHNFINLTLTILYYILFNYDMTNCHWSHSNFVHFDGIFSTSWFTGEWIYAYRMKRSINRRPDPLRVATVFNYYYEFFSLFWSH